MWLIDTRTERLTPVVNAEDYAYAILSHTWGDEEVTFEDMKSPVVAEKKLRYDKIAKTCTLARQAGLDYAWVDTCCIDKSSSAELSEAISSMFRWYQLASVCYVWLEELPPRDLTPPPAAFNPLLDHLSACRWFHRGWTLQELIAPSDVLFFDSTWDLRGTKRTLVRHINTITCIDRGVLLGTKSLSEVLVGRRMSWAARRKTTRPEDRAYSLLGIFDVNMPMVYGEGGTKAFLRLQEEIAKNTNDLSLFAWEPSKEDSQEFFGMFAPSPAEFLHCNTLDMSDTDINERNGHIEFAITNRGLSFRTSLLRLSYPHPNYTGLPLWCGNGKDTIIIPLAKTQSGYARALGGKQVISIGTGETRLNSTAHDVCVPKSLGPDDSSRLQHDRLRVLRISQAETLATGRKAPSCEFRGFPASLWDADRNCFLVPKLPHRLRPGNHLDDCIDFIGIVLFKAHLEHSSTSGVWFTCGYYYTPAMAWAAFIHPAMGHEQWVASMKRLTQEFDAFLSELAGDSTYGTGSAGGINWTMYKRIRRWALTSPTERSRRKELEFLDHYGRPVHVYPPEQCFLDVSLDRVGEGTAEGQLDPSHTSWQMQMHVKVIITDKELDNTRNKLRGWWLPDRPASREPSPVRHDHPLPPEEVELAALRQIYQPLESR